MKMMRRGLGVALALLLAGCAMSPAVPSGPPKVLQVIGFPGGFNWPIWVAQTQGFFAREGVAPVLVPTPNSRTQMTGLIEGKYDIAMTAIDNVIAYREGQAGIAIDGSDLVTVMGGDNGFLKLVGREDVRSVADLRGKDLAVDSLTTGYAFVLMEIMERNGLVLDRDYKTVAAGGGVERYNAMVERKFAGTLLISPFDVMAKARGLNVITDASAALGSYQGYTAAVRRSWARENERHLVGYIRAYRQGVAWLYDPANREAALDLFMRNVPNSTRQTAETSYAVLLDPVSGMQRNAAMDLRGVQAVLDLRAKYGKPPKALGRPESYYDARYYERASRP
ncbi:MAG TPA: ABC transporter substrate-binding protein [Ramlibacter sp.]|jgi:ABC-type nitrate/sulfonate/bicarbonate transport system substrate-binding protein|nr:ABC transporter substrate-binding protein [Ramlibacter sp.]